MFNALIPLLRNAALEGLQEAQNQKVHQGQGDRHFVSLKGDRCQGEGPQSRTASIPFTVPADGNGGYESDQ